jgi:phosphoglycerate-specific signal transduction histidine kinase
LDWEIDASGEKLAEMSRKFPGLIERRHYNLLLNVRAYRKKFGRGQDTNPNLNPVEVDETINQALAYLESIHNMNQWGVPKLDDLIRESKTQR